LGKPRIGVLLAIYSATVIAVYSIAYVAIRFLRFDLGSAIFDAAPAMATVVVAAKCAKTYRMPLSRKSYWMLVVGSLAIEISISVAVVIAFNPQVLGMHLSLLPFRVIGHGLLLMYLYSNKNLLLFSARTE
jgi:hypothetical protein